MRMEGEYGYWQIGPDLAVRAGENAGLAASLDHVFGAFRTEAQEIRGRILALSVQERQPGILQLFADGQPAVCARPDHALPVLLETVLTRLAVHATPSCGIFHAALVELDGAGILLPGERGAGKSTLSLYLAQKGGRYFGDDLAFFRRTDRTILAFPKAVTLKEASFAAHPESPTFQDPLRGPVRYFIPGGAGCDTLRFDQLRALVFPEYDEKVSGMNLRKVGPELAALSLVQQMCGGPGKREGTLPLIAALIQKPAFYLTYARSEDAEAGIRQVLERGAE